jgi:hypothetical protein
MERMSFLTRSVEKRLRQALARQKSVLLLGPRQTGKTTLLQQLQPDTLLNLLRPEVRQRYERSPQLLGAEVEALAENTPGRRPLVALDEVQRVPELVNSVQDLIDRKLAQFILTGSSARKLRRVRDTNWLPGRLIPLRLDPFSLAEQRPLSLEHALSFGSLPGIVLAADDAAREEDLRAYTTLHLRFWRDPDGPEVDWVLAGEEGWLPVEVKWSEAPGLRAPHMCRPSWRNTRRRRKASLSVAPPRHSSWGRRSRLYPGRNSRPSSNASDDPRHRTTQTGRHHVHRLGGLKRGVVAKGFVPDTGEPVGAEPGVLTA